jgi:hypothetical protein
VRGPDACAEKPRPSLCDVRRCGGKASFDDRATGGLFA